MLVFWIALLSRKELSCFAFHGWMTLAISKLTEVSVLK